MTLAATKAQVIDDTYEKQHERTDGACMLIVLVVLASTFLIGSWSCCMYKRANIV